MKRPSQLTSLVCLVAASVLAGCDTLPQSSQPAAPQTPKPGAPATPSAGGTYTMPMQPPVPPPKPPDQAALADGIELYNKGEFNEAIKRLTGSDITLGSKQVQLSALKYLAFSYCVSGRNTLCRQQFEKAFRLDPAFDLAAGEHGHPLWGPAFNRAKKAVLK